MWVATGKGCKRVKKVEKDSEGFGRLSLLQHLEMELAADKYPYKPYKSKTLQPTKLPH